MGLCKGIIRLSVITGVAAGGVLLAASASPRFAALLHQAKGSVVSMIDAQIDDPVVLRAQLRDLERQYPARIAEVRSELDQINQQIEAMKQDKLIAAGVVELVQADLEQLRGLIEQAELVRQESPTRVISVRFDGELMPLDQAYANGTRLRSTLAAYATRVQGAERDLAFLTDQRDQLAELAATLEAEQMQFQAQIWQLDAQIAMIERNNKMIEIVEARTKRLDELDRFEAASLGQLTERMARIRSEQEQRLAQLNRKGLTDYEQTVKTRLEAERLGREVFNRAMQEAVIAPERLIIEGTQSDTSKEAQIIVSPEASTPTTGKQAGPVAQSTVRR